MREACPIRFCPVAYKHKEKDLFFFYVCLFQVNVREYKILRDNFLQSICRVKKHITLLPQNATQRAFKTAHN